MKPKTTKKLGDSFLTPNNDMLKVEGSVSYHEGLRAWSKILIKKEIIEVFKGLKDREKVVNYLMAVPQSITDGKKFLEELSKSGTMPVFLLFKSEKKT